MARLSDIIEAFIKELIENTQGTVEIQRNELANRFNCVPSQINYVISTRFSTDQGYFVESRRGGGGHIRIRRVQMKDNSGYIMHIINAMGDSISQQSAEIFLKNFVDYEVLTLREAMLIKAAISDRIFMMIDVRYRDVVRASILKNMLTSLIVSNEI